ncbi:MAG: G5 domain-containing protein [Ignavibacteriales bacterium]
MVVVCAVLLAAGLGLAFVSVAARPVTIVADGRVYTVRSWGRPVGDLLSSAGIALQNGDVVTPGVTEKGAPGTVIIVERATPVTILADGQRFEVLTTGQYVSDAVRQSGLAVSSQDLLCPVPQAEVVPGMTIALTRVEEEIVTKRVDIPFQVQKRDDSDLELGTSKVIQQGKRGLKEVVVKLIRLNGRLLKSQVISEKVLQQPSTQVVAIGTCGVISRGGQTIRFKKAMDVVATAYTPGPESTGSSADGYTATGLKAGYGIVAVDPRVIKLGSRLYVEGYGFAVAGDVGGAIKGARIDVCFESTKEAYQWGRRRVRIYLL